MGLWYFRPGDGISFWAFVIIIGGGLLGGAVCRELPKVMDVSRDTALYIGMAVVAVSLVVGLVLYIRNRLGY